MRRGRGRERGVALIAVLLTLTVLSVMVAGFLSTTSTATYTARALADQARLKAAADAGVHLALAKLLDAKESARPLANGTSWTERFEGVALELTVQDVAGLVHLNRADGEMLLQLFEVTGLEPEAAAALSDAVLDYRDRDRQRRPAGAEDDDYAAAGLPFGSADRPFVDVAELQRVLGMTPTIYDRVREALTVFGRHGRPDADLAPPLVGKVLGLLDEEEGPRPSASAAPAGIYQLKSTARLPGGGTFVREAVIQLRRGVQAPPVVLDWRRLWG